MSAGERETLQRLATSQTAPHREVLRAQALIAAADGAPNSRIAKELGVSPTSVRSWRRRFEAVGLAGWGAVRGGRGRKHSIPEESIAEIVSLTSQGRADGRPWTSRSLAEHVGVSRSTVHRVWASLGIRAESQPDADEAALGDDALGIAGIYVNSPDSAIVLYRDRPGQGRSRGRGRPTAARRSGGRGQSVPDALRTQLDSLAQTIRRVAGRPERHEELIDFLTSVERTLPDEVEAHVVYEGPAAQRHPAVLAWLSRRARFRLHQMPRSGWLAQVGQRVRDTAGRSKSGLPRVPGLIASVEDHLHVDEDPDGPYIWTATAESVVSRLRRSVGQRTVPDEPEPDSDSSANSETTSPTETDETG